MVSNFSQVVTKHTLSWYNHVPSHYTIRRTDPIMHCEPRYKGVFRRSLRKLNNLFSNTLLLYHPNKLSYLVRREHCVIIRSSFP